jgi:hypothetical protein
MDIDKLKEVFPEVHKNGFIKLNEIEQYIKAKAKLYYKFDISYDFVDERFENEDQFCDFTFSKEQKKTVIKMNLLQIREGMLKYGIPLHHLPASVIGSFISVLCSHYINSICIYNYTKEFDIDNQDQIEFMIDLIYLSFATTILNLPAEQIAVKTENSLRGLWFTKVFADKDELSKYVLGNLDLIANPIIDNHHELHYMVKNLIGDNSEVKDSDFQQPGSISNTDNG